MPAPKNANQELTTRELQGLAAYKKHVEEFKSPPSHRQLATYLGLYVHAAQRIIKKLTEKGYLKERPITMRVRVLLPSKKTPPNGAAGR